MRRLTRFLKGYYKQLILGPTFKLIEAIFELIVPLVMVRMIDIGVAGRDVSYVWRLGGVLVLLGVVGLMCALVCQYSASVASQGVGTALRAALYRKINTLSFAELDRFGAPSLVTRITNDVNQLQFAVAMLIRLVIRAPFLAIGAMIMAFSIDATLSLVFLATLPLIAFVLYRIMSRSVPHFRVMQQKLDRVALITRENLSGARPVRAFSMEPRETARFSAASEDVADTGVRVGRLSALLNPLTYCIANLGIVAILWVSGFRVQAGALTAGEVIALVNYMTQILLALVVVANLVVTFTKASASAARVNEIFDTQPTVTEPEHPQPAPGGACAIAFHAVDFRYPGGEQDTLNALDFSIMTGETIGIIGGTGSGKSTLAALIARFYDTSRGSVSVLGQDVRAWSLAALRRTVSMVPQDCTLISGTIAENLRWNKEDASEAELLAALSTAQALEFVNHMPDGVYSRVEASGRNLSGGQRQRLTIARALVGAPPILILDDAASALDLATDAALRRALRRDVQGATVLMISQRISTVAGADRILVLDDGRIVGFDTHAALLKSCPLYREIALSQGFEEVAQ